MLKGTETESLDLIN